MGKKWIMGAVEGREPWSWRKARERGTEENTQENISPEPLARKTKGADFQEFLQPASLEDWN